MSKLEWCFDSAMPGYEDSAPKIRVSPSLTILQLLNDKPDDELEGLNEIDELEVRASVGKPWKPSIYDYIKNYVRGIAREVQEFCNDPFAIR